MWLRDNCRCPECFHPVSRNRTSLMRNLRLDATPDALNLNDGDLLITWDDGHEAKYGLEFLRSRAFTEENVEKRRRLTERPEQVMWGKEYKIR